MSLPRDPIGDYLREKLSSTPEPYPDEAKAPWRPSLLKIASISAVVLVVGFAVVVLYQRANTEKGPDRPVAENPRSPSPVLATTPVPMGKLFFAEGEVHLVHGEEQVPVEAGRTLLTGDVIETGPSGSAGVSLGDDLVVLGEETRLVAADLNSSERIVRIERGVVGVRISRAGLELDFTNARATSKGSLFSLNASDGRLRRLYVAEGEVSVERKPDGELFHVSRARVLYSTSWSLSPGQPDRDILSLLDSPSTESATEPESPQDRPNDLVGDIRQALANDDIELAIDLVQTEGKGRKDAGFLIAAADVYREAGKWSDAAAMYTTASKVATGKEAERVLLRAAEINLRKLGDPEKAMEIIDRYLQKFPSGTYLEEGIYLAAVIHVRLGHTAKARAYYKRYIDTYPAGVQAVRVHVALAQILAKTDCPAALIHLEAARSKSKSPAVESELLKVEAICSP